MNLLDTCEQLVKLARKAGAAEAEAYAERTRDASVRVRDGEVEQLEQASSKGIGLRVITGQRLGFTYGTDLSKEGLQELARKAVALARAAAKDVANGLPRGAQLGAAAVGEYDPAIEDISPEWKLQAAREGGEGRASRGCARAQVRFHRRRRLPLPVRHLLQPWRERGIARVLCLRVLLPGGGGGRAVANRVVERHAPHARQAAAARGSGPHRRPPGRADAGRAQAEDAAGACRVRTAAGGGIHRRHLLRRERPARAQEVELSRRAAGQAGRRARSHAGGRRNAGARHRHTAVRWRRRRFPQDGGDRGRYPAPVPLRRHHSAQGQGEEHRQRIARLGQSALESAPATFI